MSGRLRLITVPFNSAGLTTGCARMPEALEAAGLLQAVSAESVVRVPIDGLSTRRGPSGYLAEQALVAMVRNLTTELTRAFEDDAAPLVIGGDCAIVLGPLAALNSVGGGGLVFVDGHEDSWPPLDDLPGEASDSELGMALGLVPGPRELADVLPAVTPGRVLALGPRDSGELVGRDIPRLGDTVLLRDGDWLEREPLDQITRLVRDTAATAPAGWCLHVDLDVLSSAALAAVDYEQPGGLSWERLEEVTSLAIAAGGCRGASIAIYNPDLDSGAAAPRITQYAASVAAQLRA